MLNLKGIFACLPTPFDREAELYAAKVQHNVAKWNRVALAGYVVAGEAGEGSLLCPGERKKLLALVRETAADSRILIADVSAPSVWQSAQWAEEARELGYHAVTARPPQLLHQDPQLYLRALADHSPLPLIAAGRFDHPNILAANVLYPLDLAAHFRSGAAFAFSHYAAAAPYSCLTIEEAVRKREYEAAEDWQARIARAQDLVTRAYGIPGLKHALDYNGYFGGACRLPYPVLPRAAQIEIEEALHGLRG
jgi:4-hydroxy-2-oxoglutarate aldolase